jgi:hypothetical protein
MTNDDKKEIKEIIHDVICGYHAKIDAQNTITNSRLKTIDDHLKTLNGKTEKTIIRVTELEKKELVHYNECPIIPKVRIIEDQLLSQTSVKKFMGIMFVSGVSIGGIIVGVLKLFL